MNEPVWDLSSFFPSFESDDRVRFSERLAEDIDALLKQARDLDPLEATGTPDWCRILEAYEEILTRFSHLGAYLGCLTSCDVANESYRSAEAAHLKIGAELTKIRVELMRGLRVSSEAELNALLEDRRMKGAEWFVRRLREEARFQMTAQQESLAADLGVDGIQAWGRLYSVMAGKMNFQMEFPDGKKETVPMSRRRGLMADPDRAVRREAFFRGNEVWAAHEDILGSALNAIAGTRLTLNRQRGVAHFLDVPLFESALKRQTLDAMHEGIERSLPALRNCLRQAAEALGIEKLDWYDLEAPMPSWGKVRYSWEDGVQLVTEALERVYPDFAGYYRNALEKRWVDARSRPGKLPGAYCTGSVLRREERVFLSYDGSMEDLITLAHEFGHAWHSHLIEKNNRPLVSSYPMTLAETASTFGEALFLEGLRQSPGCTEELRAAIRDVETNRLHSFLVNIPVRFAFEQAFYNERTQGEVPVSRLKVLMEEAQQKYYGDALGVTDPYFWASKLHFFITEVSFYNFPYAFGFLLSRAMFQRFRKEGPGFLKKYELFLCHSGKMSCEEAASSAIGADLTDPAFWTEAVTTA